MRHIIAVLIPVLVTAVMVIVVWATYDDRDR
jgi:hypothetical protein